MASLPESFDTLITALEANVELTERWLNEEKKQTDCEGTLAAKRHNKWQSPIECLLTGHVQCNCPERANHSSYRTRRSSIDTVKTKDKQRENKHVINKAEVTE